MWGAMDASQPLFMGAAMTDLQLFCFSSHFDHFAPSLPTIGQVIDILYPSASFSALGFLDVRRSPLQWPGIPVRHEDSHGGCNRARVHSVYSRTSYFLPHERPARSRPVRVGRDVSMKLVVNLRIESFIIYSRFQWMANYALP